MSTENMKAGDQLGSTEQIEQRIAPLRNRLARHPLYSSIRTPAQLRIFMESHVYAVWDFMSLLKSLQRALTSVDLPWTPTPFPASRRFINEIVLGEESDQYNGTAASHFELYLDAMRHANADTTAIEATVRAARSGNLDLERAPAGARRFVESTFHVIHEGSLAAQAAAFTFGREDAIPDMFRAIVRDLNRDSDQNLELFIWYLERHIEVDGDEHGPLALNMVRDLCAGEKASWEAAAEAAETALLARIEFWDSILSEIQSSAD